MGGDRGKKRRLAEDSDAAAESAPAAERDTGGRRLFRRAKKNKNAAADDEQVLSADAAAKMAERKAQRENLRALRERKLSAEPSPPAAGRSSRRSSAAAGTADARSPVVLILRGPAAAGKSTIATSVVETLRRAGRSVCYLEQDYFRNTALGHGQDSAITSAKMLKSSADAALEHGYDVVLEGILNSDPVAGGQFRPLLAGLIARRHELADSGYRANVGLFYLDVPLRTTKLRHSNRAKAEQFGAEMLDAWWKSSQKSGLAGEVTLEAAKSGGEAGVLGCVTQVLAHVGLGPNGQPL